LEVYLTIVFQLPVLHGIEFYDDCQFLNEKCVEKGGCGLF
jgi:hypothetical protein